MAIGSVSRGASSRPTSSVRLPSTLCSSYSECQVKQGLKSSQLSCWASITIAQRLLWNIIDIDHVYHWNSLSKYFTEDLQLKAGKWNKHVECKCLSFNRCLSRRKFIRYAACGLKLNLWEISGIYKCQEQKRQHNRKSWFKGSHQQNASWDADKRRRFYLRWCCQ